MTGRNSRLKRRLPGVEVFEMVFKTHRVEKENIGKVQVFARCGRKVFRVGAIARPNDRPTCKGCAELEG
jgi:hypothetical protein